MKKLALALCVVVSTSVALADKDRGGGNAVGNQLLDFYENEGSVRLNVRETEAYRQVLNPLVRQIRDRYFGDFEQFVFSRSEKIWLLEPKDINTEGCINESIVRVRTTVVACQSETEVRISKHWYENQANLQNRAGLLLHEMLVAKIIGTPTSERQEREQKLRIVVRMVFAPSSLSSQSERTLFARLVSEFSGWQLAIEPYEELVERHKSSLRMLSPVVQRYCASPSTQGLLELQRRFDSLSSASLSIEERAPLFALATLLSLDPSFGEDFVTVTLHGVPLIHVDRLLRSQSMAALGLTCTN